MLPQITQCNFRVRIFRAWTALDQNQRYTYRVLQTIQMKLILLCLGRPGVLGSAKTALKFKYGI